jgi:DNA invertase Pin-like site-specific DNA recombinase
MSQYALYARKSQEDEGRQQQSIADQVRIMTEQATRDNLFVRHVLEEEKSAKEPYQRPIFDSLIQMIQAGQVDSILCYHVNRLARNMVEGGLLQHLLTKGQLREIRTSQEAFRTGDNILPFVLQTAMSTQYSLDLAHIVRRGQASKVAKGGYLQRAPEGYVNNLFEHSIEPDPERFTLVRKAWDLMLSGSYSVDRLALVMRDQWGYQTRKSRKIGGHPIHKSSLHRLFRNVFYTGYFLHNGELYKGSYQPMVTFEEFETVQRILGRHGTTRPRSREFAYTGLITCGSCGRQITAEHKTGHTGRGDYTYYHCTGYRSCGEKAIRQDDIEAEIDRCLSSIAIPPTFRELAVAAIERCYQDETEKEQAEFEQQNRTLEDAERRMSRLIKLSIAGMISDLEFEAERRDLQQEINELKKASAKSEGRLETARDGAIEVVKFVTAAPYEFREADDLCRKREIARRLGVAYRLQGGTLEAVLNPLLVPFLRPKTTPIATELTAYTYRTEQVGSAISHQVSTTLKLGAIEPSETGSEKQKGRHFVNVVPSGGTEGTILEAVRQVFILHLEGLPRMLPPMPDWAPQFSPRNQTGKQPRLWGSCKN